MRQRAFPEARCDRTDSCRGHERLRPRRERSETRRRYRFRDSATAVAFGNRVAAAAGAADHHPDIMINYNRVAVALTARCEGGLRVKDFDMPARIEAAG